jgi:sugar lactone lactonase YvrE
VGSGLSWPEGVAVDAAGNVYIADTFNDRAVKVTPSGSQSTVPAGFGPVYGIAVDVPPTTSPYGQAVQLQATVMSQSAGLPKGTVTFFSGTTKLGGSSLSGTFPDTARLRVPAFGVGNRQITATYKGSSAYAASTSAPIGVDVVKAPTGISLTAVPPPAPDVFVADTLNNRVLEVTPSGSQSTVGTGLDQPTGVAVDAAGDVYIADTGNNRVVKVTPSGSQSTVGSGFNQPTGVAVDAAGDVYVLDSTHVAKVTPSGVQSPVVRGLNQPAMLALDTAGDVFVSEGDQVLKVPPIGLQTTVGSGLATPQGLAADAAGDVYIADTFNDRVVKVTPSGTQSTIGSGLFGPQGLAVDAAGDVYIGNNGDEVVKVTPSGSQSVVSSGLNNPEGLAVDVPPADAPVGQVTLQATLIASPPHAVAGSVTFRAGSTKLGTATLSGGSPDTATLTLSGLQPGAYQLTAAFAGNAHFSSSKSAWIPVVAEP